jgi:hypothetical protein
MEQGGEISLGIAFRCNYYYAPQCATNLHLIVDHIQLWEILQMV